MKLHYSALALALLAIEAPGSDAFQNGNTPQQPTKTATSKPPMPFKWPVVGTLPDFLKRGGVDDMGTVYKTMYEDFGPTFGMSIMGDDQIVFSDPRVMDQALRKEGLFPVGGAEFTTETGVHHKSTQGCT